MPKAPPISGTLWLNSEPLTGPRRRHRPTIVLFWSSWCETSWVALRRLEAVAERFPDLVTVAVHSPRYEFERDADLLRRRIGEAGVTVPVVHDRDLDTWARYGPTGHPTVVGIDHRNRVVGAFVGIPDRRRAGDEPPDPLLELAEDLDVRARAASPPAEPLPEVVVDLRPRSPFGLSGPSAVVQTGPSQVAVADRGNRRLIVLDLVDGRRAEVVDVFADLPGIGRICALPDGALAVSFPDRGSVERIDLSLRTRTVVTDQLLRPWGITLDRDGSLVVADAGAAQLIRLDGDRMGPIAGSGATGHRDGWADRAELVQPVDVIRLRHGLVFAEAASNRLRILTDRGRVMTILGRGGDTGGRAGLLDGPVHRALLQRPSGLAPMLDDSIAVADAGNGQIRILRNRRLRTLPVRGLRTPEAVTDLGGGRLLVCDSGNDRLAIVDEAARTVTELELAGLPVH